MHRFARHSFAALSASATLALAGGDAPPPLQPYERCGVIMPDRGYMQTPEWARPPEAVRNIRKLGAFTLAFTHYSCVVKAAYVETKRDDTTIQLSLRQDNDSGDGYRTSVRATEGWVIYPETVSDFAIDVTSPTSGTFRFRADSDTGGWAVMAETITPDGHTTSTAAHTSDPLSHGEITTLTDRAFHELRRAANSQ